MSSTASPSIEEQGVLSVQSSNHQKCYEMHRKAFQDLRCGRRSYFCASEMFRVSCLQITYLVEDRDLQHLERLCRGIDTYRSSSSRPR